MFLMFLLSLVGSIVVYHSTGSALFAAGFVLLMGAACVYGWLDSPSQEV